MCGFFPVEPAMIVAAVGPSSQFYGRNLMVPEVREESGQKNARRSKPFNGLFRPAGGPKTIRPVAHDTVVFDLLFVFGKIYRTGTCP
ncbi:MAG: hypothetical protein ACI97A_000694 [Planctomycetota bacterium]|jgi:hypothetical protein